MNLSVEKKSQNKIVSQLSKLMCQHQLTPSELSRLTGVPQPTIYRLLHNPNNDPRLSTMISICNYFQLSMDYFNSDMPSDVPQKHFLVPTTKLSYFDHTDKSTLNYEQPLFTETPNNQCIAIESTDSMQPKIPLGSFVLIDPLKKPEDGDIILCYYQNNKRYALRNIRVDGAEMSLSSLNSPDTFTKINHDIEIHGTAFQIFTRL